MTLIFGGRFDPPHLGHLEAIEGLLTDLNPREIRVLPTGRPAHKPCIASGAERLEMVRRLLTAPVADGGARGTDWRTRVVVDDREILRAARTPTEPTYSYETLLELARELGAATSGAPRLAMVIGVDQLEGIAQWHRFPAVLGLCAWVVLERQPEGGRRALDALRPLVAGGVLKPRDDRRLSIAVPGMPGATGAMSELRVLPTRARSLSSTEIRAAIARTGQPPAHALPASVLDYMKQCKMYGLYAKD